MNKKFLSLFFILFFFQIPLVFAQNIQLTPPTLQETLAKNEEFAREQATKTATQNTATPETKYIDFTYRKVFSGNAINIYRANEAMLWMQEIDLSKGATADSSLEVVSYNEATGEPQYQKKTISETLASLEKMPTSLINGQFFNPKTQPSELSFGLKQ